MSFLRFTCINFRETLSFRQVSLTHAIIGQGFATQKVKSAQVVVPKRPINAYLMFVKENRSRAAEEYPDLQPKEIMRILNIKWKALSEDQKKPYKDTYAEKMKNYNAPLSKLPKKPAGPFGLFLKEKYPEASQPGVRTKDIMSRLSAEWQSLSETEKSEWVQKREALKQQYNEQVMNFGKELTAEERAFLEQTQGAQLQKLQKEQRRLLGFPKRPMSAFILFSQRNSEDLKDLPITERTKILGRKWREMFEDEKEKYQTESRQAFEKYHMDVDDWMEKNPEAL